MDEAPNTDLDTGRRCAFPGCHGEPETKAPNTPGPPPKYCERDDHNPLSAWRLKRKQATTTSPDSSDQVKHRLGGAGTGDVGVEAETARETVLRRIDDLRSDLDRYTRLLAEVADPEAAQARILAIESEAQARVAAADQRASTERTRRVAAEEAVAAAEAATELAVAQLDADAEEHAAVVAQITATAEGLVADARAEQAAFREQLTDETDQRVRQAENEAAEKVRAAEQLAERASADAAARIAAAETATEQARVDLDRLGTELTGRLKATEAALAEAEATARAADVRARAAEESARWLNHEAELRQESIERARQDLLDELERTRATAERDRTRVASLDARVDELRAEVDAARAKLSAAEDRAVAAERRLAPSEQLPHLDHGIDAIDAESVDISVKKVGPASAPA